jgi:hypothetical protein
LECSDEVCDVKDPEEGAQAAAFCESFEDVDIGGWGAVAVEDADTDGVVEGAQVLPNVVKDAIRCD